MRGPLVLAALALLCYLGAVASAGPLDERDVEDQIEASSARSLEGRDQHQDDGEPRPDQQTEPPKRILRAKPRPDRNRANRAQLLVAEEPLEGGLAAGPQAPAPSSAKSADEGAPRPRPNRNDRSDGRPLRRRPTKPSPEGAAHELAAQQAQGGLGQGSSRAGGQALDGTGSGAELGGPADKGTIQAVRPKGLAGQGDFEREEDQKQSDARKVEPVHASPKLDAKASAGRQGDNSSSPGSQLSNSDSQPSSSDSRSSSSDSQPSSSDSDSSNIAFTKDSLDKSIQSLLLQFIQSPSSSNSRSQGQLDALLKEAAAKLGPASKPLEAYFRKGDTSNPYEKLLKDMQHTKALIEMLQVVHELQTNKEIDPLNSLAETLSS